MGRALDTPVLDPPLSGAGIDVPCIPNVYGRIRKLKLAQIDGFTSTVRGQATQSYRVGYFGL